MDMARWAQEVTRLATADARRLMHPNGKMKLPHELDDDTAAAIALSERVVTTHGALTVGVYSTRQEVIDAMTEATWRGKVALSINLTGGVFVNQSSAFSDYHGTGGNPAANASYADSAFVANRFRVVQRRYHV